MARRMAESLIDLEELSVEEHILKGIDEEHEGIMPAKSSIISEVSEKVEGYLEASSFMPSSKLSGYCELSPNCDGDDASDKSPTPPSEVFARLCSETALRETQPGTPVESTTPKNVPGKECTSEKSGMMDGEAKNELIKDLTKQLIELNEWRKQTVLDLVDKDRVIVDLEQQLTELNEEFDSGKEECLAHQKVIQELKLSLEHAQAQIEYLEGVVGELGPSHSPLVVHSNIQQPWLPLGPSNHIYFPLKHSTLNSRGSSAQSFNISRFQMSLEPDSSMSESEGREERASASDI